MRLLVIAALIGATATAAAAAIVAEPPVRVVAVAVNGTATATITLRNPGTTQVVVTSISPAPACDASFVHAAPLAGFTLAAGATRAIAVSCTAAPASMQRCTYHVNAGSEVLADLEAVCAYAGSASLAPSPAMHDFGPLAVGGTAAATINLRNDGAAFDHAFFEITDLTGTFAVAAPCNPDAHECDAQLKRIPTGGILPVDVTCTPRSADVRTAELHVTTSAGTRLTAPIALACSGLGVVTPVLSATPAVIDVGAVEVVGGLATASVHLGNAGGGTVTLHDIQIADGGTGAAADWSYRASSPCPAATVPPDCPLEAVATALEVRFDPSAIGVRDATLLVNYHDTADRSLSIPLRGTGTGVTLDVVGRNTLLDFGALPVGGRASLAIQVVNRGSRTLSDATATVQAPFSVVPVALTVTPTAPTTVTVTCAPTTAGVFGASLVLAAPDLTAPVMISLMCTGDPAATLTATPPALLFGEVRLGTIATVTTRVASLGAPILLDGAKLVADDPQLAVTGVPATTPATLAVTATPDDDGALANQLSVTPGPLLVPISGVAVTAKLDTNDVVSIGTFCVRQPTTPRIVALASAGTATIGLPAAPVLGVGDAFDLALVSPLIYPTSIEATGRAQVAVTPRRQDTAGVTTDTLRWTTDVAGQATVTTGISATFIDDGGAIAPSTISFPATPIHLDSGRPRQVTLQNCSLSPLMLDAPQIASPFSIDSPSFPSLLQPGETATFSVGFHPTKLESYDETLTITSPQLPGAPLTVHLFGLGVADGNNGSDGFPDVSVDRTSFYACGSCASSGPSSTLALVAATLAVLIPRRRRR